MEAVVADTEEVVADTEAAAVDMVTPTRFTVSTSSTKSKAKPVRELCVITSITTSPFVDRYYLLKNGHHKKDHKKKGTNLITDVVKLNIAQLLK